MAVKKVSEFPVVEAVGIHVFGRQEGKNVQTVLDVRQSIRPSLEASNISTVSEKAIKEALEDISVRNKGYFKTESDLKKAYPNLNVAGDKAYVGNEYPYLIYYWDELKKDWITDGTTGGDSNVDLGKYYTKEETLTIINDYHEVLTQEEYDAILAKENKFYFTYEE